MKRNIERQEAVVSALWEFAADLQLRPRVGCVSRLASGPDKGAEASLDHIGTALRKIMSAFGYQVLEVQ